MAVIVKVFAGLRERAGWSEREIEAATLADVWGQLGLGEQVMAEIAETLKEKHELCEVAIHHRTGRVDIGGISVVIAVSAPHRAAALAACKEAIDTLKETVPLWKKEIYEGGEEWIGRGS